MSARSNDSVYKYILIGDQEVGKTAIVNKFVSNSFSDTYTETIGVDFNTQYFDLNERRFKIQWWDASGNEKYRTIVSAYFKSTSGILAVYDITSQRSFDSLKTQLNCLKNHLALLRPVVFLIGNKTDLEHMREVCIQDANEYARSNGYVFRETSTRNAANLNDILSELIRETIIRKELKSGLSSRSLTRDKNIYSFPRLSSQQESKQHTRQDRTCFSARSSRSTNLIDARSNSFLVNRKTESEHAKTVIDLNEQITSLKSQLDQKDKLIYELSLTHRTRAKVDESILTNALFTVDASNIQFTSKESASVCKNHEHIALELTEEKAKNKTKEAIINELKVEIDLKKCEIESLTTSLEDYKNKIVGLENDVLNSESLADKSQQTIISLQQEISQFNSKINDLETQISATKDEKQLFESNVTKINASISELSAFFSVEISSDNFETVKLKISELIEENKQFRVKKEEINERLIHIESENKIANETVQRLVAELNNYEKEALILKQNHELVKLERDSALSLKQTFQSELDQLKEKYQFSLTENQTASTDLDVLKANLINIESQIQKLKDELDTSKSSYSSLVEDIALLLSDDYVKCEKNAKDIKEKIQLLMSSSKSRIFTINSHEETINQLNAKLDQEANSKCEFSMKSATLEVKLNELEEKYKELEKCYQLTVSNYENLSTERLQFSSFVSSVKRLFSINCETNFSLILAKIEQLSTQADSFFKLEKEKAELILNYDKKIELFKEQLQNKEIHMELLRKKIVEFEEMGKSEIKKGIEDQILTIKKMKVKIEKLNAKIAIITNDNIQLKSQILDINSLQKVNSEITSEKLKLLAQINDLNSLNTSQKIKINELKEEIDNLNLELSKMNSLSGKSIQALSAELRLLKLEYEKSRSREKELLEFRDLVAKKLGLEVQTLSLVDYEIISRIEQSLRPSYLTTNFVMPTTTSENYERKSRCCSSTCNCQT